MPGALLAAAYMLRLTQKMAWGEPASAKGWRDLNLREWVYLVPVAFFVLYIGLAPRVFFNAMDPSLEHLSRQIRDRQSITALADRTQALPAADDILGRALIINTQSVE